MWLQSKIKQNIQRLLPRIVMYAVTINLSAITYSDKTFLSPRPISAQSAVTNSIWHTHVTTDVGNPFGMTVQVTGVYQQGTNRGTIGEYFGVGGSNSLVIKSDQASTLPAADFPGESIVHNPTLDTISSLDAKLTIKPGQTTYGALFGIFKELSSITPGLSCTIIIPVYHNRTEHNLTLSGNQTMVGSLSIADYFKGTLVQSQPDRLQAALGKLLIGPSSSRTSFGNITGCLQYNIIEGADHLITIAGGLNIGAGGRATSATLFEPLPNTGEHCGITFGLESASHLWHQGKNNIELITNLLFTHFLGKGEHRVLGLLSQNGAPLNWGHYRLGGKRGTRGVFPLATILHRPVHIAALNQIEAGFSCAFHFNTIFFTTGASLFAAEGERVSLKTFEEKSYGLTSATYDTTHNFSAQDLPIGQSFITKNMLDLSSCATPAQLSGTLSASLGYSGSEKKYPTFFGLGFLYEIPAHNSSVENLGGWATLGLSF